MQSVHASTVPPTPPRCRRPAGSSRYAAADPLDVIPWHYEDHPRAAARRCPAALASDCGHAGTPGAPGTRTPIGRLAGVAAPRAALRRVRPVTGCQSRCEPARGGTDRCAAVPARGAAGRRGHVPGGDRPVDAARPARRAQLVDGGGIVAGAYSAGAYLSLPWGLATLALWWSSVLLDFISGRETGGAPRISSSRG